MRFKASDLLIFQGMKRSGNHAVIDWMMDSSPDIQHFNNIFPIRRELERPGTYTFPVAFRPFMRRQKSWAEQFWRTSRRNLLSIEDFPFGREFFIGAGRTRYILLIRSAENLFSSRIHKGFEANMPAYPREIDPIMHRTIDIWIDHVANFIANSKSEDFIGIVYDRWIIDADYRSKLAGQLGLQTVASPRKSRAKEGGGSSFDRHTVVSGPDALLNRKSFLAEHEQRVLKQVLSEPRIVDAQMRLARFLAEDEKSDAVQRQNPTRQSACRE